MEDRISTLRSLIALPRPLEPVLEELRAFPWDSDPLITLQERDIVSVLSRYIDGEISASEAQAWAEAIEVRDDIAFDEHREDLMKEFFFRFSNPTLEGAITPRVAADWLSVFRE